MKTIIPIDRSIVPACDVETIEAYEKLVKSVDAVDGIGGYKIGFELGLRYGLPKIVEVPRKNCGSTRPLIYDHQKAATDIPDTGKKFARVLRNAGIDALILFPQAGPETERAWIEAAFEEGLGVMVGGMMTHKSYVQSDGGYLSDSGVMEMYRCAARCGVKEFVVPGTKPDVIKRVRELLVSEGVDPIFHAPGFVTQGGSISDAAKVAGKQFHAIVGRALYEAADMKSTATELCKALKG